MKTVRLLAFAQAQEVLGFGEKRIEVSGEETARQLVQRVHPGVDVSGWRVAMDLEYADWEQPIGEDS
ncbi:MAG: hypothetical protein RLZZ399_2466, partial [Verrucomicrobiota bacterium]